MNNEVTQLDAIVRT